MLGIIKSKIKEKKGFTLVEVIVVMTIIITLIAIVGPNTIGYINSARTTSNKATARAVYIASMQVAADAAMKNKTLATDQDVKNAIKEAKLLQGDAEAILKDTTINYDPKNYIINSVTYLGEKYPEDGQEAPTS
ncbi:type II secretion system protein [uncultured Tyzzerella sp.]|uniref:type II secretion system protein n=1 Tax=uncultured Tyzzerella sp. TaxID=2321398 RepID=UPI0029425E69|nr:type II secretion system protein [uncultured Tyzzerella sp.]